MLLNFSDYHVRTSTRVLPCANVAVTELDYLTGTQVLDVTVVVGHRVPRV